MLKLDPKDIVNNNSLYLNLTSIKCDYRNYYNIDYLPKA